MDEVCLCIKSVCDNSEIYSQYIDFKSFEDKDWKDTTELTDYISSELKKNLGVDVVNIKDISNDDKAIVQFSYKGSVGEIWETYNTRGYHYWVVSF